MLAIQTDSLWGGVVSESHNFKKLRNEAWRLLETKEVQSRKLMVEKSENGRAQVGTAHALTYRSEGFRRDLFLGEWIFQNSRNEAWRLLKTKEVECQKSKG